MATTKPLKPTEISTLFDSIESKKYPQRDKAMLALSIYAGMRVSEIAKLKNEDVFDLNGILKDEIVLKSRKNCHEPKVIYLSEKVKISLNAYLQSKHDKHPSKAFFHADKADFFTTNGLTQWFFTRYRQAGIEASSDSGHKTFCQSLASKGVGIKTISSLVGHRHRSTTKRYLSGLYSETALMRSAVNLAG
jgi:integrase/recombinase XerD